MCNSWVIFLSTYSNKYCLMLVHAKAIASRHSLSKFSLLRNYNTYIIYNQAQNCYMKALPSAFVKTYLNLFAIICIHTSSGPNVSIFCRVQLYQCLFNKAIINQHEKTLQIILHKIMLRATPLSCCTAPYTNPIDKPVVLIIKLPILER